MHDASLTEKIEALIDRNGPPDAGKGLLLAASVASSAHEGQKRADGRPYFGHCLDVALIVLEAGGDVRQVAAALLHDTIEDSFIDKAYLTTLFGDDVADLVDWVTDSKEIEKLPRAARKAAQAEKMRGAPARAKLVKLADQISNLEDMADLDIRKKRKWLEGYLPGVMLVVEACADGSEELAQRARKAGQRVEELLDREGHAPGL